MNKFLLLCLGIAAFNLQAMESHDSSERHEDSLKAIIERIEQGPLARAVAYQIVAKLTTKALENPGNLIARAYLWAMRDRPKNFFAQSESGQDAEVAPITGMALAISQEYELAPEMIRNYLWDNFLDPSMLAININKAKSSYLDFSKTQNTDTRMQGEGKQLQDAARKLQRVRRLGKNKAKGLLEDYVSSLVNLCNTNSLRAFEILKSHYPHGILKPLDEKRLTKRNREFLTRNYLGKSDELTDGALEFRLANEAKNMEDKGAMVHLAITLGYDGALINMLRGGIEQSAQGADFDATLREPSLFAARALANPETVLVAGVENLLDEAHKEEAISLLEHFLALPEATPSSLSKLVMSRTDSLGNQKYTPHALTRYYLDTAQITLAIETFFRAFKKGFAPSPSLVDDLLSKLSGDGLHKDANLREFSVRLKAESLGESFHLSSLLMSIYLDLDDAVMSQFYFTECINKLILVDPSKRSRAREARITFMYCLSLFTVDERLWASENSSLAKLALDFINLEQLVPSDGNGTYCYALYLLNRKLGNEQESDKYLKKAMVAGHEYATMLYKMETLRINLSIGLGNLIAAFKAIGESWQVLAEATAQNFLNQFDGSVVMNESQKESEKEERKVEETLLRSDGDSEQKNESNGNALLSEKEVAANNINAFIAKWQDIHWKGSDRSELLNDFQRMVLQNDAVKSGNSTYVHGNHGRRKSKYGNRASSFEINTLIERARKFLAKLT